MPAPPYSAGTEHAEQAELGHLRQDAPDRSDAARSSSRIRGATSRAPHSRTVCSSSRCSSVRSKSIMNDVLYAKMKQDIVIAVSASGLMRPVTASARVELAALATDYVAATLEQRVIAEYLSGRDARRHHATTSPPHDVLDGALQLGRERTRYFPPAPIFAGGRSTPASARARRGIAAEAGDYRFVAPDNGVAHRGRCARPAAEAASSS